MQKVKDFFLFCAGVDRSVLEECPTDVNKYLGIGGTVFFTGLLAFFSAGYAIYTVFDNYFMAVLFGLIWGLMIFNLDRYIVSSMKSQGKFWRDFIIAFPRLIMAVLLALVISKPLELKIFEKEINAELITMEQEVYQRQEAQVQLRFDTLIKTQQAQVAELQTEIDKKQALRDQLTLMAIQEADGTGGSGKKNLGPIYRAKKADADKAQAELEATEARLLPVIAEKQANIQEMQTQLQSAMAELDRQPYGGMAARMDALHRLGEQSPAIWFATIFITLLFIAIETAPIFVKLISYRSPYDYVLQEREYAYQMANLERTTILKNATINTVQYDTEIGEHKNKADIEVEKARIDYEKQGKLAQWKWQF